MANSGLKEKVKLYEALLCGPGMIDTVKISFQMSRRDVLLFTKIIEAGLGVEDSSGEKIVSLIGTESREAYQALVEDMLKKSGLNDFNEKIETVMKSL
jgi:hypothetical protein